MAQMATFASKQAREFYARTYDLSVPDWPGEMAFYRDLAGRAHARGQSVLEVACGTGRVAIRLAQDGAALVGLDRSDAMLAVARRKSRDLANIRWVQGDMRAFDLGQRFGLILIPGHSFQNLLISEDQVGCMLSIRRHLVPGGALVVHLDHPEVGWLGSLVGGKGGVFEAAGHFAHPETGRQVRKLQAWAYEPATQTAIAHTQWQEIDGNGNEIDCWDSGPLRFRCVGRFEMEHLLARTGFEVESLFGNFFRDAFADDSREMIWVATVPAS
jgi:ubiquinone/menaquinone biosynthesis C-methylase UbiE